MPRKITKITRGELTSLAAKLPSGEERNWCEASARGPVSQPVYADSEMLGRCQELAKPAVTTEHGQDDQPGSNKSAPGRRRKPSSN